MEKVDQICVSQEGAISFSAMREFLARKIGLIVTGASGEPVGWLEDLTGGNVRLHREQFKRTDDGEFCLRAATAFITGKIKNCRLILRRYGRFSQNTDSAVDDDLSRLDRRLTQANSLEVLRGLEEAAARTYFGALGKL